MYMMGILASRRLGRSLGLDIIGADGVKRCNMNCVYCEVGNGKYVVEQGIYADFNECMRELKTYMDKKFDVVTFSGNGEPTLNTEIGRYIDAIHEYTSKPVCVITNATTLDNPDVVKALNRADIVMPSIDAVVQQTFNKVDRGYRLDVKRIMNSIREFSYQYPGKLYLETLLVKGYNDKQEDLLELVEFIKEVNYDEFHLNTVDRIPAEDVPLYSKQEKSDLVHFFEENGIRNVRVF